MLVEDVRLPRDDSYDGNHPEPVERRQRSWLRFVVVFGSYCFIGLLSIYPAILHGPARVLQSSGKGDLSQEVWFLEFIPWSILHGHSPFISNWINAPKGANLLSNTSFILPSILASPITLAFGPIAGFNFLVVAAFALSAYAMYFVVAHWVTWKPAAYFAGLLYGFSPLAVGQGLGHLFLVFEPLPPLILYALYRGVIVGTTSPRRSGIVLGLLLAAQFFVSSEILAAIGMVGIVGTVVFAAVYRKNLAEPFGRALSVARYAIVSFAIVCVVPLMLLFFGADRYSGPAQSVRGLEGFKTDLFSIAIPNGQQLIRPVFILPPDNNFAEADLYLGIPLLAVLVVACVKMWKRRGVRLFACVAVAAWVLSLGPRLRVYRHMTPIPLPFSIFGHLPVTNSFVPARLSLFVYLFGAPILAIGLGTLRTEFAGRSSSIKSSVVAVSVAVLALFPLIPKWPYPSGTLYVPQFITSSAELEIPPGSTVVTYPFPDLPTTTPMSWQALDAMRYKLAGGEMITPGKNGRATFDGITSLVQHLSAVAYLGRTLPPTTPSELQEVRGDLQMYGADTVIVAAVGKNPEAMRTLYEQALGIPGSNFEGTYVWFHVHDRLVAFERR